VDEACALISEPANVKLRVVKSKKTDFAFLFDKVLDAIEANNKLKAEGFMREMVLEEEQAKKDKQARQGAKVGKKSSSKGKKAAEAASTASPDAAAPLEQQDMQVMTTLSGLLEQSSAEWSSTSPARLRQMLKDAGGDVGGVSEKRMKKIKAWALASPVAVRVARRVDGSASLLPCCALCGKTKSELAAGEKLRSCSGCGAARYCSSECQKTAWPGHKKECSGGLIRMKSGER
jgi:hypothetical protein